MKHGRNPNTSARPLRYGNDPGGGFDRAIADGSIPGASAVPDGAESAARLSLPVVAREALSILEGAGGEGWCVGGFVRDLGARGP